MDVGGKDLVRFIREQRPEDRQLLEGANPDQLAVACEDVLKNLLRHINNEEQRVFEKWAIEAAYELVRNEPAAGKEIHTPTPAGYVHLIAVQAALVGRRLSVLTADEQEEVECYCRRAFTYPGLQYAVHRIYRPPQAPAPVPSTTSSESEAPQAPAPVPSTTSSESEDVTRRVAFLENPRSAVFQLLHLGDHIDDPQVQQEQRTGVRGTRTSSF